MPEAAAPELVPTLLTGPVLAVLSTVAAAVVPLLSGPSLAMAWRLRTLDGPAV